MNVLRLCLLGEQSTSLKEQLEESNLIVNYPIPDGPQASGEIAEIVNGSGCLGTLAVILHYWVKDRSKRRVFVNLNDSGKTKSIDIAGYSISDCEKILSNSKIVNAVDMNEEVRTPDPTTISK
tara:strand:+ start:111 stop:479 length:369 start_codon:yes stop_codon:yes gene_type:complete